MSIIAFDGFDMYDTYADMGKGRWSLYSPFHSNATFVEGRFEGQALRYYDGVYNSIMKVLPNRYTIISFGLSVRTNLNTEGSYGFFQFNNVIGPQCTVRIREDGSLALVEEIINHPRIIAASAPNTILPNTWTFIEGIIAFGSNGSYQINVNRKPVLVGAGATQGTSQNSCDGFTLGWSGAIALPNTDIIDYDDLYIGNNSDIAPMNSFLNEWRIEVRAPWGDTVQNDLVGYVNGIYQPANYICVSVATEQGDNSIVTTSTGGSDLYLTPQWVDIPTDIYAIQVFSFIRKLCEGGVSYVHHVKSEWNEVYGEYTGMGIEWKYHTDLFVADPNTGSQWTGKAVNALKAGFVTQEVHTVPPVFSSTMYIKTIPQPLILP